MRFQGVHHLAIQVRDPEGCAAFYRDVLGLPELSRQHREDGSLRSIWVALTSTGAPEGPFLALEHVEGPAEPDPTFRHARPGPLLFTLRISTADRAGLLESLASHQVEVQHQTRWTVYVRDPEGNRVAFSHHPHDPLW